MAWISVWQEVDGPKLRKLSRALSVSKAEALGILCFLWFWGMNNADETGRIMEAGIEDIIDALQPATNVDAETVVEAMFETEWLDVIEGDVYIHDWDTWQEQWYRLQRDRKTNAERMRKKRLEERERSTSKQADPPKTASPKKSKAKPDTKDETPQKVKYAEYVSMTPEEHDRLVSKYGMPFATACIEELDNYKGAKPKSRKYESDYRAILSWVVASVKDKKPGLMSESANSVSTGVNPFEDWGE